MGEHIHFEVNQDKAFENVVVKYQVNIEILTIQCKPFLSGYKGKTSAQFQKELLQVINQSLLQITFKHMGIRLDLQELHDIGVLHNFFVFRLGFQLLDFSSNSLFVPAGQNPLIIHGIDLTLQLPDAPCRFDTFFQIESANLLIRNAH